MTRVKLKINLVSITFCTASGAVNVGKVLCKCHGYDYDIPYRVSFDTSTPAAVNAGVTICSLYSVQTSDIQRVIYKTGPCYFLENWFGSAGTRQRSRSI